MGRVDPAMSREGARVHTLRDMLPGLGSMPTYRQAVDGDLPPICWFRTDAVVVIMGCYTAPFADAWGTQVLRRGASARGTTMYSNNLGALYWFWPTATRDKPTEARSHYNAESWANDPNWSASYGQK